MCAAPTKILVVDDEEKNVKLMEAMLVPRGYHVIKAYNGQEALEKVSLDHPDLILLDVMMPVLDGYKVCKQLKDDLDTRLIPIVIMTALGQTQDRIRGIEAGADDFLTKPVNKDELLARINNSLRMKQTIEQKMKVLEGAHNFLAQFVPESVKKSLEENPEAPQLEKMDQDMSALFVDVTGYTRLSENIRQTADFIVEKYFSRYLDSIRNHKGDVTETSGDAMMAVFPGVDATENAHCAVTAALEIMQTTNQLNQQLKDIFEPISMHIGINSGVASIGPTKLEGASSVLWTYTALGPVINLAARIADVAESDTILVGPETARRIKNSFELQELGKRSLKNVKEEVIVSEVIGERT